MRYLPLAALLLLLLAACGTPEPIACMEDAKVCPDGTTLSRTGPDCSFPDCPALAEPQEQPVAQEAPPLDAQGTLRALLRKQPDGWTVEYTTRTVIEGQQPLDGTMRRSRDLQRIAMRSTLAGNEIITVIDGTGGTMCIRQGAWQCSQLDLETAPETSTTDADVDALARDFRIALAGTCSGAGESGTLFRFTDKEDDSITVQACYAADGLLLRAATTVGGIGLSQDVTATRITRKTPAASDFILPTPA